MPSLVKQGALYSAEFFCAERAPRRKRVPLHTRRRRDAEAALALMVGARLRGLYDPWTEPWDPTAGRGAAPVAPPLPGGSESGAAPAPSTLGDAADHYLASVAHLRPDTQRTYRSVLRLLAAHAGRGLPLAELDAERVRRWLDQTHANDVTRRKYVHHVGYLVRHLVRLGLLDRDVTKAVKLRRVPEMSPKAMTPEMVGAFIGTARGWEGAAPGLGLRPYCYGWLADLVEANVELGLRRGELLALRPEHVHLGRGVLVVENGGGFQTKSGRQRAVPLSSTARAVLARRLTVARERVFEAAKGPLTRDGLTHAFGRVRARAELPEWVNLHSTRHTALTRLAERGVPVEVIRQFAGHGSIVVTERYTRMRVEVVADLVRRAFG